MPGGHGFAPHTLVALQRVAKGLAAEDDAVKAGLTLSWSNGPVAGQITRVKLRKRQLVGRARLALLDRRVVRAPGRLQEPGPHPQEPSEVQTQPAAA